MFKDLLVGRTEKEWYRLMFWGSLHLIYHMTQRKSSYKSVQGGNFTQSRLFFFSVYLQCACSNAGKSAAKHS